MELVRVSASYFEARDTIADRIPDGVSPAVREQLLKLTESVSGTVRYDR
jgi:hypothetical protein